MKKIISLKLGGSVIFKNGTEDIDFDYLGKLKTFLKRLNADGFQFILNIGGGKLAKIYQELALSRSLSTNDVNWVGTAATVINAHLVRGELGDDLCEKDVFKFEDYLLHKKINFEKGVLVAGGSGPGHSNEYNALLLAEMVGNRKVFVVKDVGGVYTSDPDKDKSAKMIKELSWDEYIEVIGNPKSFIPKSSVPVDIVASRKAREDKIVFQILSGRDFENLEKAIRDEDFVGTTITFQLLFFLKKI